VVRRKTNDLDPFRFLAGALTTILLQNIHDPCIDFSNDTTSVYYHHRASRCRTMNSLCPRPALSAIPLGSDTARPKRTYFITFLVIANWHPLKSSRPQADPTSLMPSCHLFQAQQGTRMRKMYHHHHASLHCLPIQSLSGKITRHDNPSHCTRLYCSFIIILLSLLLSSI
jgi:hypothetical protein